MSDGGSITTLEEFFLSREFGQGQEKEAETAFVLDEVWARATAIGGDIPPLAGLDRLFVSRDFGSRAPHRWVETGQSGGSTDGAARADEPLAAVLAFAPRTGVARHRAVAAFGGVAAAAAALAGTNWGVLHQGTPPGSRQQAVAAPQRYNGTGRAGSDPTGRTSTSASPARNRTAGTSTSNAQPAPSSSHSTGATLAAALAAPGAVDIASTFSGGPSQHQGAPVSGVGITTTGSTSAKPPALAPGAPASTATSVPAPPPAPSAVATPVTEAVGTVDNTVTTIANGVQSVVPVTSTLTGVLDEVGTAAGDLGQTLPAPRT